MEYYYGLKKDITGRGPNRKSVNEKATKGALFSISPSRKKQAASFNQKKKRVASRTNSLRDEGSLEK